jgi:hypothetical protein
LLLLPEGVTHERISREAIAENLSCIALEAVRR